VVSVDVADIDGDGLPDVMAAFRNNCPPEWLRQQPDGTFVRAGTITPSTTLDNVRAVPIAADGSVAMLNANGGEWTLFRQQTPGVFGIGQLVATYVVGSGTPPWVVADMDGDGMVDLVFPGQLLSGQTGFVIVHQMLDGSFGRRVEISTGFVDLSNMNVLDVDGDGKLDIVTLGFNTVTVYRQSAPGQFEPPATRSVLQRPFWVRVTDLNGDGRPDMLLGHGDADHALTVHIRQPDGSYAPPEIYPSSPPFGSTFEVADVTGDGRFDVIALQLLRKGRAVPSSGPSSVRLGPFSTRLHPSTLTPAATSR
jgi:hypothetical protein